MFGLGDPEIVRQKIALSSIASSRRDQRTIGLTELARLQSALRLHNVCFPPHWNMLPAVGVKLQQAYRSTSRQGG